MKTAVVSVSVLLAILIAGVSRAADKPTPRGATCKDISYDAEFLKAYPRAPAACQEVVEVGGKRAARFTARVAKVKQDYVQLLFLNTMGAPIQPETALTLLPQAGQTMMLNGKPVAFNKLSRGDKVDFWIPERQLGFISDPSATAVSTIILP